MIEPKIRACIENSCSTLRIIERTLPYDSINNTGGWGSPNIDPTTADNITLVITSPSGSSNTYNIDPSSITTPVTGEFTLMTITADGDGSYIIKYIVIISGVSYSYVTNFYNLCSVRCCVDKLWAKAATDTTIGDCGCTGAKSTYSRKAADAESLYSGILSCIACNKPSTRDLLLKKLQRICNLEKCNCE